MGSLDVTRPHVLLRVTGVGAVLAVLLAVQYAGITTLWVLAEQRRVTGTSPIPTALLGVLLIVVPALVAVWCYWRANRYAQAARNWWSAPTLGLALVGAGLIILAVGQTTIAVGCALTTRGPLVDPQFSVSLGYAYSATYLPEPIPVLSFHPGGACSVDVDALPLLVGFPLVAVGLWFEPWIDARLATLAAAVESTLSNAGE
ncbi:hypothetical protein ACFR9U_06315 [Halorientalis brevis]|uniref:Uncharacterized protein n=1 Tax=Halorientalis brevis TaxID=1126241 RepID=A0ABD6C9Q4_9EURY|nr:hypothetical protein [Halorientalis brevis]